MGLRDLDLEIGYESDLRDITMMFYNPVLAEAEQYDRITAYFNSRSFVAAASGLAEFVKHQGKMRLLIDSFTSKEDIEVVEEAVQSKIKEDLEDIEEEAVEDHVALLAWLLQEDRLEIKIAKARRGGTVHPKVGVFVDDVGDRLAFEGSVNETFAGWTENIESLTIYKDWIEGQSAYVDRKSEQFKRYWWDDTDKADIYDLDDAVREQLLEYAPQSREELERRVRNVQRWAAKEDEEEKLSPRYYQEEAMNRWEANEFRGIWKMATGTGKTLTSIWGMQRLLDEVSSPAIFVVVCPFSHLLEQWKEELEEQGFKTVSTQHRTWERDFESERGHLSAGSSDSFIVLTTYDKYHKEDFRDMIRGAGQTMCLVCDEVHHAGAPTYSDGLVGAYDYRLGLSATPERYMDEQGTTEIMEFFGGVVFEHGLEEAIREGHLSPYNYHIRFIDLTEDEEEKYREYSKKLASYLNREDLDEEDRERIEHLSRKRSNILKKAKRKEAGLDRLIADTDLEKAIIFCEDSEQVDEVENILDQKGVKYAEFTQDEDNEQRERRARNLDEGKIDVLVAMGVLDEGFDLPAAKQAILMSSTGNPAQFVQRRGRVLRTPIDRQEGYSAEIFDFLVLPGITEEDYEPAGYEETIVEKELKRFSDFARLAENYDSELRDILENVRDKYDVGG